MEPKIKNDTDNFRVIIISIVVLVLIVSGSLYLRLNKKSSPSIDGVDVQLVKLRSRASMVVPKITSAVAFDEENLAPAVTDLIGFRDVYTNVKSVTYENGMSGFTFDFDVGKNVRDTYFALWSSLEKEGWVLSYGSRYEDAGMFNVENANYLIAVEVSKLESAKTQVKVIIVNKK